MGYLVEEIMKKQVISVDSGLTAGDVAKMMGDANVGCVVIMEGNTAIGIVTERDFVKRLVGKGRPSSTPIREIMSSPLIVINPEESVWELAELMKLRKIHKVPVVKEGRLVGIATTADITRLCSIGSDSEMRKIVDQIMRIKQL